MNKKLKENFLKFKEITKEEFYISQEIKKHLKVQETDVILDVGCSSGDLSKSLTTNSTNITFLDVDEFNFSPQEEFIHSSFEEARINKKYDIVLSSHVWGHFHRNNTFDFCFDKACNLLKENGKLVVVHNSNKDFTGELIRFTEYLFGEVEFDVFHEHILEKLDYEEFKFEVNLKADSFLELAEMVQVLMIVPDNLYYSKIDQITEFLKHKFETPEFAIQQKLLVI